MRVPFSSEKLVWAGSGRDQHAVGLENAPRFQQGIVKVGDVVEHMVRQHYIEGEVGEGKLLCVGNADLPARAVLREHPRRKVDGIVMDIRVEVTEGVVVNAAARTNIENTFSAAPVETLQHPMRKVNSGHGILLVHLLARA
jgi:hypothetical protein